LRNSGSARHDDEGEAVYPGTHGRERPDHPALIMAGSGEVTTYRQLDERSNQVAHLLEAQGLAAGDGVAILLENNARYLEAAWATQRAGLLCTPVNRHLNADEVRFIVEDSGAKALVTSTALLSVASEIRAPSLAVRLLVDGAAAGFLAWDSAVTEQPSIPVDDERAGSLMLYSSGTTGRPRGIVPTQPGGSLEDPNPFTLLLTGLFGFDASTIYLCPAPMYHAAPLGWSMGVQRIGGTVVLMERFDAQAALAAIERHGITHAQFVPTMLIRMLRLPAEVRDRYDLSSLRFVVHAAAPCPADVKEELIDWLGPIVHEYYSASEGHGFTAIDSKDWLAHRGSVGRPLLGAVHVLREDGSEADTGESGTLWFEGGAHFRYHHDDEKTASATDALGRATVGDIGYVDEDGFVYLTDRQANLIIAGGVNIYPQEAEDILAAHPDVLDAAVIGVPDPELGEQVKAVVQLVDPTAASEATAEALIAHCRERLALYKCPRTVDFVTELPRLPNGKLLKRTLRARYWDGYEGIVSSQVQGSGQASGAG